MGKDGRRRFSEQELGEANQRMIDCLQKVEDGLKRGPWLAGRDFSLADIAIIPFVDRIRNLRPDFVERGKLPRLVDWYEQMKNRPSFDRAFAFRDDPRAAKLPNL